MVVEFRGWNAFLPITSHSANFKLNYSLYALSFILLSIKEYFLLNLLFCCSDSRGPAPNNRGFDKAPEDSVKKLCFVIVVVVSEPN